MNRENLSKIYITETTVVSQSTATGGLEIKRGNKMRLKFRKSLKTHVEKMSAFRLSTMLMKTRELKPSLQDVDENKGGY